MRLQSRGQAIPARQQGGRARGAASHLRDLVQGGRPAMRPQARCAGLRFPHSLFPVLFGVGTSPSVRSLLEHAIPSSATLPRPRSPLHCRPHGSRPRPHHPGHAGASRGRGSQWGGALPAAARRARSTAGTAAAAIWCARPAPRGRPESHREKRGKYENLKPDAPRRLPRPGGGAVRGSSWPTGMRNLAPPCGSALPPPSERNNKPSKQDCSANISANVYHERLR